MNSKPILQTDNTIHSPEYEQFTFENHNLRPKPCDIPDDYIAYNPSAIWTTEDEAGNPCDIMYLRIEPNYSGPGSSHLGKSYIKPYIIDVNNPDKPLEPFGDESYEIRGEDPALTRIKNDKGEDVWLLSCIDVQPFKDRPDQVKSLHTKFYIGKKLNELKHIANGPEGMKDIRISQRFGSKTLDVYGRPQPEACSGNITHTVIENISNLNAQIISDAKFIDESLFPIGSGIWGGTNDVIPFNKNENILIAHRAKYGDIDKTKKEYEAILLNHNIRSGSIKMIGTIATADKFRASTVKADEAADTSNVVFPGGGHNGKLDYISCGLRDGSFGTVSCLRTPTTNIQ